MKDLRQEQAQWKRASQAVGVVLEMSQGGRTMRWRWKLPPCFSLVAEGYNRIDLRRSARWRTGRKHSDGQEEERDTNE